MQRLSEWIKTASEYVTPVSNIEYGLGSGLFAIAKIGEWLGRNSNGYLTYLPYWGLADAAFTVLSAIENFSVHSSYETQKTQHENTLFPGEKYLRTLLSMGAAGFQGYESCIHLGLNALSGFYLGMAVKSGANLINSLLDAIYNQQEFKRINKSGGNMNAITRERIAIYKQLGVDALSCIGWIMLACGNPLGAGLLLGASLCYVYKGSSSAMSLFKKNTQYSEHKAAICRSRNLSNGI